ncbi:MAG TPA: archaetidylserine decarboxylase [Steroidobacteraceae bacterium]|nr:archaetidylserine decarboxylase [Steroidobacteraceae bacterium]
MRPGSPASRGFILLQHLLPQHTLSRVIHALARVRWRAFKNLLIRGFVAGFRPDMSDARQPDPLAYESFNAFFTRELAQGTRPLPPDPRVIVSPVDGFISQVGYLTGETIVQAKGRSFSLGALLAGDAAEITDFAGGAFATLYLAPFNYHRIHMPWAGRLHRARHVPGRLFSVNAVTAAAVDGLFARNERVVCIFEDDDRQRFAMALVGALFVGSISTIWHGEVTPPTRRQVRELPAPAPVAGLDRGALLGWFNMGSTVVLLFPKDRVRWQADLRPGLTVRVGQPLGRLQDPGLPP